jgi:uncharacterized membrane protein HdeD (DUF308 family)
MKNALPVLVLGVLASLLGAVMLWRVSVRLGALVTLAGLGLIGTGVFVLRQARNRRPASRDA